MGIQSKEKKLLSLCVLASKINFKRSCIFHGLTNLIHPESHMGISELLSELGLTEPCTVL